MGKYCSVSLNGYILIITLIKFGCGSVMVVVIVVVVMVVVVVVVVIVSNK